MPSKYASGYTTDYDFFDGLLDETFSDVEFEGEYAKHLERDTKTIRRVAVVIKENKKYVGAYVSLLNKYRNKGTKRTRQGYCIMRKALRHRLKTNDTLRIPPQYYEASDTEEEAEEIEEEDAASIKEKDAADIEEEEEEDAANIKEKDVDNIEEEEEYQPSVEEENRLVDDSEEEEEPPAQKRKRNIEAISYDYKRNLFEEKIFIALLARQYS